MTREAAGQRHALVVLAMHRSGSSALTRCLSLMGGDLPSNQMEADVANERGYWESRDLYELHEESLESAGSAWHDWRSIPEAWFGSDAASEFRRRARKILDRDFHESSLFVVKDPRVCRLVPFWLELLSEFGSEPLFVILVRHPLEIAASLKRLHGFSRAKSLLLFLGHMLDAERHSRGRRRAFAAYEGLLRDGRGTMERISGDLQIDWPRDLTEAGPEIDEFLHAGLRHFSFDEGDLAAGEDLPSWIGSTYSALLGATEGDASGLPETLDAVAREVEAAELALGPILAESERRVSELTRANVESAKELDRRSVDLERLESELAGARSELEAARLELRGVLDSRILRWTAPLRRIVGLARDSRPAPADDGVETGTTPQNEGRRLLRETALFDTSYYLESNPDVAAAAADPIEHYLEWGAREARVTHPLFDAAYYLAQIPDSAGAAENPLVHFLRVGWREGFDPHPLFDTSFYLGMHGIDEMPYTDPVTHYLREGASRGFEPHPFFDAAAYLKLNPDVAIAGTNPLLHYVLWGQSENRATRPA